MFEIKCILHAVVNSLCSLGPCPLVWHMHGVCLLHGHVAHSSHSAEELDSRFASEWETHHFVVCLMLVLIALVVVHAVVIAFPQPVFGIRRYTLYTPGR